VRRSDVVSSYKRDIAAQGCVGYVLTGGLSNKMVSIAAPTARDVPGKLSCWLHVPNAVVVGSTWLTARDDPGSQFLVLAQSSLAAAGPGRLSRCAGFRSVKIRVIRARTGLAAVPPVPGRGLGTGGGDRPIRQVPCREDHD